MEERTYQGHTYRRSGPDQPWQLVAQQSPSGGRLFADPYKPAQEKRAEQDQVLQEQGVAIQRDNADRQRRQDEDTRARGHATDAIDNPQRLRKEYAALPEVREYKVATQMASAGLRTAASPQGDIALTYSFAKAMDPGSVVRDQEAAMVTNSQPWFQTAVEGIKKQFGMDGAGNFTPEARARIRAEILKAVASRKPLYEARRSEMTAIALSNDIEPSQVIGKSDTDIYASEFRKYAEANGDDGDVVAGLIGGAPINRPKPAGMGATQSSLPIPPEMQQAHNDYLAKNWGHIDPQDYAAFRINLDKQFGFGSDPEGYKSSVPAMNDYAVRGGKSEWMGNVPAVTKELSGVDRFRNDMLSNPVGAGVASAANAGTFGLPSLFAPDQTQALREEYPSSTFIGEVAGGLAGTGLAGGGLKLAARGGESAVARALANPLAADMAYGGIYGATQAEDPLYGAVGGALSAFAGNRIGGAVGRAFPRITGTGSAIRAADETVPSSGELRDLASELYGRAEATGQTAIADETLALADNTAALLAREGRLSPTGRLTEVQPKVKEAFGLIGDYAGETMAPKQVQTVRAVISDGLNSADPAEKRIAGLLLNNFDEWTDTVTPELASGLRDARGVASRYMQGDKIAQARELADVRAGQFSNSGQGNALRTDFRQLDRGIAKGRETFSPGVEAGIRDVARGTPISNALRNVGRFAPTGPVAAIPTLLAMGGGGATAGPLGIAGGLTLGGLALGARKLGADLTERSAQVAENSAYGGPEYDALLSALLETSQARGGHGGAVLTTDVARALADKAGY